jgi:flagellar biosynthesis protein FlhF
MFVKKFEAPSMEQALLLVKTELGPNALILSTTQSKGTLFSKPSVEVTAAYETKAAAPTSNEASADEDILNKIFPHRKTPSFEAPAESVRKTKLNRYVDLTGPTERRKGNPYEEAFLRAGFSSDSARDLSNSLLLDYPKEDLSNPAFFDRVRFKLVSSPLRTLTPDFFVTRPAWTAIGMAGHGKTALLVKLAMLFKRKGRQVRLIGGDKRKLLGLRELQSYARLIKVPFHAESQRSTFPEEIQLVDSPSLSLSSAERPQEIEGLCEGRSVLLVLDASARLNELLRFVDRAEKYRPAAVAFTRLDSISQFGIIYDVLKSAKLPLLGASLSQSFRASFKFFDTTELVNFILKGKGVA